MSNIFYYDDDGKAHGPLPEIVIQGWYCRGWFSSDVKFKISTNERSDDNGSVFTLGELIRLNGRLNPFFFCPEKTEREMKQDETQAKLRQELESLRKDVSKERERCAGKEDLDRVRKEMLNHMMQEMDSLRGNHQQTDLSKEKNMIIVLQAQVQSLLESHTHLQDQVSALSIQKENAAVSSQLEMKVNELKKRVEEQEKNFTSMRKEISAINSKCDKNDAKMEKMIETQNKSERTVTDFDKRISDLKASDKSIRESVTSCEQNVASSSNQLKSISNELNVIKKEVESQRKNIDSAEKSMKSAVEDIEDLFERVGTLTDRVDDIEDELQPDGSSKDCKSSDDSFATPGLSPVDGEAAVSPSNRPPWDAKKEKAAIDTQVKKEEDSPWDKAEVKTCIDSKVREEEGCPWDGEKEKGRAHKAGGDCVMKEEEGCPWDRDDKAVLKSEVKGRNPWDDGVVVKTGDEPEPWNEMTGSGKTSAKKEPKQTGKAGNGLSIDQKDGKKAEKVVVNDEKTTTEVKPVSRAKDWAAICRELSSDEEEDNAGMKTITHSSTEIAQWLVLFTRDAVEVLRIYCSVLDAVAFSLNAPHSFPAFDFKNMLDFCSTVDRHAPHYGMIREAILREVRAYAAKTVFCTACNFIMTTPRHLFYHLTERDHGDRVADVVPHVLGSSFSMMSSVVSTIFYHFIESIEETAISIGRERSIPSRPSGDNASHYRPSHQFSIDVVNKLIAFSPTHIGFSNGSNFSIPNGSEGQVMRDTVMAVREYFKDGKRKEKFEKKFKQHMSEGTPGCSGCSVIFDGPDEYYEHIGTYDHLKRDDSIFGLCMYAWKGSGYWNAML